MPEVKCHPAVLAGLMGSAAWGVPSVALATPLDDLASTVANSLLLQFVIGCTAGAAIAGAISVVTERIEARSAADEVAEAAGEGSVAQESRWTSSSLDLMRAMEEQLDEDPTGDLGRFRTGQITIELPAQPAQAAAKPAGPRHARRARHFATAATVRVGAAAARRTGRHFAGTAPEQVRVSMVAPSAQAARGRHFAAAVAARKEALELEQAAVPVAEAPDMVPMPAQEPADPRALLHERLAALPPLEPQAERPQVAVDVVAPAADAPQPVAADAPQSAHEPAPVAEAAEPVAPTAAPEPAPVAKPRLRDRISARTRSVREVLTARLGAHEQDEVPIIPRADGTTVDVAPSWWDQTLAPALASLTGQHAPLADTASRLLDEAMPMQEAASEAAPEPQASVVGGSRASYISQHVAEVNVGMFPERRSADELEQGDAWEQALQAMGEAIAQEAAPVFQDVVGGPSTIDDPDGLEGPTGFIPFRVPAAHPEVVDTETYVDYLLRDEISHNGSPVLRRSPHAHLRVIEGGTGALRTRRRASDTGASTQTGRHFALPELAREA